MFLIYQGKLKIAGTICQKNETGFQTRRGVLYKNYGELTEFAGEDRPKNFTEARLGGSFYARRVPLVRPPGGWGAPVSAGITKLPGFHSNHDTS